MKNANNTGIVQETESMTQYAKLTQPCAEKQLSLSNGEHKVEQCRTHRSCLQQECCYAYFELISAVDSVSMCMFLRACTHLAMTDELLVMESVW